MALQPEEILAAAAIRALGRIAHDERTGPRN